MPTLHALLVGIDNYKDSKLQLNNSRKSIDGLKEFLINRLNRGWELNPILLKDHDATRSAIIKKLEHFEDMKRGDVYLFHFAGHGSYEWRDPSLKNVFSEEKIETIICHDSRTNGILDLADKELAYLISNIVKKGLHFAAIMDCCNSGDNTKDRDLILEGKVNTVPPNINSRKKEQYHGHQSMPVVPNHVQMAACLPDELATEGLFTNYLLKALKHSDNRNASYTKVMDFVVTQLKNENKKQKPNLINISPELNKLLFLNNAVWLGAVPKP